MRARTCSLIVSLMTACLLAACGGGGGAGQEPVAMAWQGARFVEGGPLDSKNVSVSINADGLGHAVWEQRAGSDPLVIFASAYRDGVWQPGLQISTKVPPVFASHPQVVTLPDGEAVAVWQQGVTNSDLVGFSRTVDGVWQTPTLLPASGGEEGSELKMVADGRGGAIAVWLGGAATTVVRAAVFRDGAFGPVREISDGQDDASEIDVAIDADGNALVVWAQHSTVAGRHTISARPCVTGAWREIVELNPSATAVSANPRVAIGTGGTASVVWEEGNYARLNGRRATDFRTGQWAFTFLGLDASGGNGAVGVPGVVLDAAGVTTIVWAHSSPGPEGEVVNLRSARGKGSEPFVFDKVESLESAEGQSLRAGVDGGGRVLAIWSHEDIGGARITMFTNVLDPATGQWSSPRQIGDDTGDASRFVSLALNARGQAIAAWSTRPVAGAHNTVANVFK